MKTTYLLVPSVLSITLWTSAAICAPASSTSDSTGGQDSATASPSTPALELQEVTVTAQRREENIDSVPISISAFTEADLEARDLKSVGDIASVTPGVDFRPVGYENWLTIRGISQNAGGGVAGLGPNTTAIYVDDAPLQARYANAAVPTTVPTVFDIDHVEVLRGPQGTLFGASAEGGAIRVISAQPSLTDYSGFARGEVSQIDRGGLNTEEGVAYGGPIIQDVLGFRVSAWSRHDGGYVQNEAILQGGMDAKNVNKGENYSTRAALLWKPASMFTAELSFYYQDKEQNSADLFDPTAGDPKDGNFVYPRLDSADQRLLLYAVAEAGVRPRLEPVDQPDQRPASRRFPRLRLYVGAAAGVWIRAADHDGGRGADGSGNQAEQLHAGNQTSEPE
jgi:outer membrane receptor for ferrienterochelin and colicin